MSRVKTIPEEEATGELADVYARMKQPDGKVANILKVQSLSPRALDMHHRLYRELMFGKSRLSRAERELIAVAVSQTNGCFY